MTECANCGSYLTERVNVEWFSDGIEAVYICEDCPAEFVVKYDAWTKELTPMGEELVE